MIATLNCTHHSTQSEILLFIAHSQNIKFISHGRPKKHGNIGMGMRNRIYWTGGSPIKSGGNQCVHVWSVERIIHGRGRFEKAAASSQERAEGMGGDV